MTPAWRQSFQSERPSLNLKEIWNRAEDAARRLSCRKRQSSIAMSRVGIFCRCAIICDGGHGIGGSSAA